MNMLATVHMTWTECKCPREIPATKTEIAGAKALLKARGWSNRRAAAELGVGFVHLSRVLNGHRQSKRLLDAIAALPVAPKAAARKSPQ